MSEGAGRQTHLWDLGEAVSHGPGCTKQLERERDGLRWGCEQQALPPLRAEERCLQTLLHPAPQGCLLVVPPVANHISKEQTCLYIARMPI